MPTKLPDIETHPPIITKVEANDTDSGLRWVMSGQVQYHVTLYEDGEGSSVSMKLPTRLKGLESMRSTRLGGKNITISIDFSGQPDKTGALMASAERLKAIAEAFLKIASAELQTSPSE